MNRINGKKHTIYFLLYCETTRFPGTHPMQSIVEGWGSYLYADIDMCFVKWYNFSEKIFNNDINIGGDNSGIIWYC